jgi:hypothetical protein
MTNFTQASTATSSHHERHQPARCETCSPHRNPAAAIFPILELIVVNTARLLIILVLCERHVPSLLNGYHGQKAAVKGQHDAMLVGWRFHPSLLPDIAFELIHG